MRLRSITVRNYRLHRELTVELDPARTLIGGPNESGKSTLAEAAHRALFLRAKGNTEHHRVMRSDIHGGHPEVEVEFEAGGKVWRIQKRFSGAGGTAKLTEAGGATLSGDEAEARLRELLGLSDDKGKPVDQWAHLWVWQGRAGENPSDHANAQRDALLTRLQKTGGAAAMQSPLDARVAAAAAAEYDAIFKQNGEAKAGSETGRAHAEAAEAEERLASARETAARLEQAAQDFGSAEMQLQQCIASLRQLRPEQEAVERRAAALSALTAEVKTQSMAAEQAEERRLALVKAEQEIAALRQDIGRRQASLAPGETAAAEAKAREAAVRDQDRAAEQALNEIAGTVRDARLRSELAAAQVLWIEKCAGRERLREKSAGVAALRAELSAQEARLAPLPAVSAPALKKLYALDGECSQAAAALAAMAARLEVIESSESVSVEGRVLGDGDSLILTDDSEVTIGGSTRLRVHPGGGTSLAEARRRVQDRSADLQKALDALSLRSVADAAESLALRQQLESEIRTLRARLEGMGAATLEAELAGAESAAAAAAAEVQRRLENVPDFPLQEDAAAAAVAAEEYRRSLQEAESAEQAARAQREVTAAALREAMEDADAKQLALEAAKRDMADREAQLRLLLQTHGGDAARAEEFAARCAASEAARSGLDKTKHALAALQPELLEADRARLARAVHGQENAKAAAEQKRAGAQSLLLRDGTSDPVADLALAEARARQAQDRCRTEQRRAEAVKLLHGLFQAEQKALADQFTAPLATKISGYLECLFGPGARAEVKLEGNEFAALQLVRPAQGAGAFDFDTLSGGAKEQLAAAVRLAMAEVLAGSHGGCLPVVFDDAFAYADPVRVQVLQRMLDLAAGRGLQIIVLTCSPGDYAALGARQISLS